MASMKGLDQFIEVNKLVAEKESADPKTDARSKDFAFHGGNMSNEKEKSKQNLEENKHSKLPWKTRRIYMGDKDAPDLIEILDSDGIYVCKILGKTYADLIVQSVNSHEALVRALFNARGYITMMRREDENDWDLGERLKEIDKALADVKGE